MTIIPSSTGWMHETEIPELVFSGPELFDDSLVPRGRHSWIGRPELAAVSQQMPHKTCVAHSFARAFETARRTWNLEPERFDADLFHQCILGQSPDVPALSLKTVEETLISTGFPRDESNFRARAPCPSSLPQAFRCSGFKKIRDAATAKRALREYWPIVALLSVEPRFEAVGDWQVYQDGSEPKTFLHAVLIVGYDDEASAWEIQNSFGRGWGLGGRSRIAYGTGGIFENELNVAYLIY